MKTEYALLFRKLILIIIVIIACSTVALAGDVEIVIKQGHEQGVNDVAFSPDGRLIASCAGNVVKLWNLEGALIRTFRGHTEIVNSIAFSPDGQYLASGSDDRTVRLWSMDGQLVRIFSDHNAGVSSVSLSPDGKIIVSGSGNLVTPGRITFRSIEGSVLKTLDGLSGIPYNLVFSPDGTMLAGGISGFFGGTLHIWTKTVTRFVLSRTWGA